MSLFILYSICATYLTLSWLAEVFSTGALCRTQSRYLWVKFVLLCSFNQAIDHRAGVLAESQFFQPITNPSPFQYSALIMSRRLPQNKNNAVWNGSI